MTDFRKPLICIMIFLFLACSVFYASATSLFIFSENRKIAITDDNYFPVIISSIKYSEESIEVIMFTAKYYTNMDSSRSNAILDSLISAAGRGVSVRVILEGGEPYLGKDFEQEQLEACTYLRRHGVDARLDPENKTTHAKLVIVDKKTVIIGSTNWNHYALTENHETAMLVDSSESAEVFENYFQSIWDVSSACSI